MLGIPPAKTEGYMRTWPLQNTSSGMLLNLEAGARHMPGPSESVKSLKRGYDVQSIRLGAAPHIKVELATRPQVTAPPAICGCN